MSEGFSAAISFPRYAFFYMLESLPYIAITFLAGLAFNFYTEWGWSISSTILGTVFACQAVLSAKFARNIITMKRVMVLFAGLTGATAGWGLAIFTGVAALFLLTFICLVISYLSTRTRHRHDA